MAEQSWDSIIEVAGDKFNILPEGQYGATIVHAESTVSKKSGNDMVMCSLKVAEGPHAGKSVKTVYVSKPGPGTKPESMEGAVNMFMRHLKGVGISFDTVKQHRPTMAQIAAVMIGKRVSINVKHDEWPKGSGEMQAAHQGPLRAPEGGALEVTEFPTLSAAAELGYDSDASVPVTDDAAF